MKLMMDTNIHQIIETSQNGLIGDGKDAIMLLIGMMMMH